MKTPHDISELEHRLSQLEPRQPSRHLEADLFGHELARGARDTSWNWAWLAPITAVFMVLAGILTPYLPSSDGKSRGNPMVAMILSNQFSASYLPGSFTSGQNRVDTFGWTKEGGFTSSNSSLLAPEAEKNQ